MSVLYLILQVTNPSVMDHLWAIIPVIVASGLTYLAATYKSRRDAKSEQEAAAGAQTERLTAGWEVMTKRQLEMVDRLEAQSVAAISARNAAELRAITLEGELQKVRADYAACKLELERLREVAARRQRRPEKGSGTQ